MTHEPQALDAGRVVQFKWSCRAMADEELRAVASRRIELDAEESLALGEVLAERGLVIHPGRSYRGIPGFLRRHWNGDYPLARSYWIHTVVLSGLGAAAVPVLLRPLADLGNARPLSFAVLVVVLLSVALTVWANVGTWASASRHACRGGSSFWAGAAQLMVLFGVLGNVREMVAVAPLLQEHVQVAFGEQPGEPVQFVLRADGKSLLLRGGINDDTAQGLDSALERAPRVTTVVLESAGGWIRQGEKIAQVIGRRGLDTYVETECSSACTIAFLAGRSRAADPEARLGFHAFRGVGGVRPLEDERKVYGAAGLSPGFIQRVRDTSPKSIWYPAHDLMLQERVLTRASLGGETAALATDMKTRDELAAAFRKARTYSVLAERHPQRFDAVVDAAWKVVGRHGTDREVLSAAGVELGAASRALLPQADDATIEAFAWFLANELAFLHDAAPDACSGLLFGGKARDYRALLPRSLAVREQELLIAAIETSAPERARHPSRPEAAVMLRRLASRLEPRAAQVIATQQTGRHTARASCAAGLALLDAVLALPRRERIAHARALLAS